MMLMDLMVHWTGALSRWWSEKPAGRWRKCFYSILVGGWLADVEPTPLSEARVLHSAQDG